MFVLVMTTKIYSLYAAGLCIQYETKKKNECGSSKLIDLLE